MFHVYGDSPPLSPGDLGGLLDLEREPLLDGGVRLLERDLDLDLERDRDGDFVFFLCGVRDLERE